MSREIVRDRAGKVLGWYEDNGVSGRINARDAADDGSAITTRSSTRLVMQAVGSWQGAISSQA